MNRNKLKKINFRNLFRLKSVGKTSIYTGLLIIIAVAVFAYLGLFLYQKVYQTIIQADEIHILQQKVALEIIDTKTLDRVLANMQGEETAETISLEEIKDPF